MYIVCIVYIVHIEYIVYIVHIVYVVYIVFIVLLLHRKCAALQLRLPLLEFRWACCDLGLKYTGAVPRAIF